MIFVRIFGIRAARIQMPTNYITTKITNIIFTSFATTLRSIKRKVSIILAQLSSHSTPPSVVDSGEKCDNRVDGVISDLKLEVDKRTPIDVFKKNLEQYVQAPSAYFKISPCVNIQDDDGYMSRTDIDTLKSLDNDATLHVKLSPPIKPNTQTVKLSILDYKANRVS